jgi:hypothetical protein
MLALVGEGRFSGVGSLFLYSSRPGVRNKLGPDEGAGFRVKDVEGFYADVKDTVKGARVGLREKDRRRLWACAGLLVVGEG